MTATLTDAPAQVRLRLDPAATRKTVLDGAWWPRTSDPAAEVPALIEALGTGRGEITHAMLHGPDWDQPHPRRITAGGRGVRMGWFTAQPSGLLTMITEFGRDRFDLFVVPVDATEAQAEPAMTAAADPADLRRAPGLLEQLRNS